MSLASETELNHWVAQVNRLWLFLDYDGTLVEFEPTPESVNPDPQVIDLINRLTGNPSLRVVIISGRRLSDILSLLPAPKAFLAGTYGIELQTPSAGRIERADYNTIRPILEGLKPFWQKIIDGRSGFYLEDKGWALALHARYAEEVETMQVIATIWQMLNKVSISGKFRIFTGYKFLEIAPALAHKGETISVLVKPLPLAWSAVALYWR